MIYLISQVTFIFLTQIYYNMNFITLSSNFITRFPWYFKINLHWLLLEDNFLAHKKCIFLNMPAKLVLRISNFVKMQDNLWKLSYILPTLLKILVFFPSFSDNCILRISYLECRFTLKRVRDVTRTYSHTTNFLTKTKKCLLCWLLWIENYQINGKYLTSNTTFSKKVNPMKYQIHTHILVRTWDFLFMYFTGISN